MKLRLLVVLAVLFALMSCNHDLDKYVGPILKPAAFVGGTESPYEGNPLWERHKDAPLRILAIGNSFTLNSTVFMPWFINHLNDNSICIARLMLSGCSLNMHWSNHVHNNHVYKFQYSDKDEWIDSEITTIDEALDILDWDIIVIQQASGLSGVYSSYEPALGYLIRLFKETNPNVRIAWHSTWPFREGAEHDDFYRYDYDQDKMYEAIMEAADKAAEGLDIKIPSTELIYRMRKCYPEVEDGFSSDGIHITDGIGWYALSCLWYEMLVKPDFGTSCYDMTIYPTGIDGENQKKADAIIMELTGGNANSVPMIFE